MTKLPRISGHDAIRALERLGFRQVRQRGSHVVLRKPLPTGDVGTVVPLHRELASGTLRGILKQAQVELQDFLDKL
ncbi:MAG: type II toxin-antitoxin system HicA family toxin [Terriglobales bacterium]